jgi:putative pyruvate formate lyase activating enzyme
MAKKPVRFDENGKMLSGIIVRHLVMPLCKNDSFSILKWLKENLPKDGYVSLMSQYTPFGKIEKFPELNRKITAREYDAVLEKAWDLGIDNLFAQERTSSGEKYIPEWDF